MKLVLKVDYDGVPFIDLYVDSVLDKDKIEDRTLERFIREAKGKGLEVANGCFEERCDRHMEIRIK